MVSSFAFVMKFKNHDYSRAAQLSLGFIHLVNIYIFIISDVFFLKKTFSFGAE